MNIEKFIASKQAVQLVLRIACSLSPSAAARLGNIIARVVVSRRDSKLMRAVRMNQWVATGEHFSRKELDIQALKVMRQDAQVIYDLYHNLENHKAIQRLVVIAPEVADLLQQANEGLGAIAVGPHMSCFDLAMCAMALRKTPIQILSYANPGGGYRYQNELRAKMGLEVTPINALTLRKAAERIKTGGLVVTAVDRPENSPREYYQFFGRPAPLPDGHVRLALRLHAPLYVLNAQKDQQGIYHINGRGPIEMVSHPNREEEIRINTEAVLDEFESIIRACPDQWLMFYPLWNELEGMIP